MKITNPALGEIEFDESDVIHFPEGMLGLPSYKYYILITNPSTRPFFRLQCVDESRISFLAVDPAMVDPGYADYVFAQDPEHRLLDAKEDTVLLVVCTVSSDGSDVTANLQAPVVINHRKMEGSQIILLDSPYKLKHSLIKNTQRREA